MEWTVRLGGDEWSLEGLCQAFQSAQLRVWRGDDERYYLTSPALSSCADEDGAWREAERLVSRINDAVSLDSGYSPVTTGAVVRIDSDGTRRVSVRISATSSVVVRSRGSVEVTRSDGTIELVEMSGTSQQRKIYSALEREGDQDPLARALHAWRSREHEWPLLRHVYEIIREDVSGGTNDYKALQKITPAGMTWSELNGELKRFRQTGGDSKHAGPKAWHGMSARESISNPMHEREAEELIERLLRTWVETKV